jgi:hypothetical protein
MAGRAPPAGVTLDAVLEAKLPETPTPATVTRTGAPGAAHGQGPATTVRAGEGDRARQAATAAGDADPLGAVLARAVAQRAEQAGALLQRVPAANPTGQPDGTHRSVTTTVACGKTVPSKVIAIIRNPGIGTVPSVSPPGWSWLELHVPRLKGNWVRFHIINRLLGGSGHDSLNLVPTSVAVNNAFSRGVETDAKANVAAGEWTYVEVDLTYDPAWPAPIPRRITAQQGTWDAASGQWFMLTQQHPALINTDITQLAGGPVYLRGDNITAKQMQIRGAKGQAGALARWLRTYTQTNDSDLRFQSAAERAGFDSVWLRQVWLDEDVDAPGTYTPVVKKLQPPAVKRKPVRKRGRRKPIGTGAVPGPVGIVKKSSARR